MHQQSFEIHTPGRGLHAITASVSDAVDISDVDVGICIVFVHHTSASLLIQENADPDVRRDLDAFFARLVPDGDPIYKHVDEGPDDMPSHIRMALTRTSEVIPVVDGPMALGTWQGIFLFEHRRARHYRKIGGGPGKSYQSTLSVYIRLNFVALTL